MSVATERRTMLVEPQTTPVDLKGLVDLNNTAETIVHEVVQPAVIHEHVLPQVHNISEESIIREIHTHDVFHRILPVIDVEVLPTKHFVPDPQQPGSLKEISEKDVPFAHNTWSIALQPGFDRSSLQHGTSAHTSLNSKLHPAHRRAEPILSSKKTYMTKEGYPRTEYVWRHPPTLEPFAYASGATVPIRMNCASDEEYARRVKGTSYEEDGLIFKDEGYGDETLPGLRSIEVVKSNETQHHNDMTGVTSGMGKMRV